MISLITLLVLSGNPSPPPDAAPGRRGLVNSTTQSFSGQKSFVDGGIVTESLTVGDGGILISGFLPITATIVPMTLYMDPAGSDSNACTNADAGCLTFTGIYSKLPKVIDSAIAVNVAAGNYAFDSRLDGISWGTVASVQTGAAAGSITVEGPPMATFTPDAGSATGSITAITATVAPLPITTDSTQSWAVNSLRGRFMTITSGALNGLSRVIVANTATTVTTMPWGATAPTVGVTYALQTPAAIITGVQTFANFTGLGTINWRRLELIGVTASVPLLLQNTPTTTFSIPMCRIRRTAAGTQSAISTSRSLVPVGASLTGNASAPYFVESTSGSGITISDAPQGNTMSSGGYIYAATNAIIMLGNSTGYFSWLGVVGETTGATATVFDFKHITGGSGGGQTTNTLTAICPSGSTGFGVKLTAAAIGQSQAEAINCGTGFQVGTSFGTSEIEQPTSAMSMHGGGAAPVLRCTGTTTCLTIARGGRARIATTATMTGVTNEIVNDGVATTFAAVGALTPKRVIGNAGSIFEME